MKNRSAHSYDRRAASDLSATFFEGQSKTVQADRDQADINFIVRQFGVTGKVSASARIPEFMDVLNVGDFRESLEQVREGEAAFRALPAAVRQRFNYDAAEFVDFAIDPANIEELRKMGLAPAKEVPNVDRNGQHQTASGAQAQASGGGSS